MSNALRQAQGTNEPGWLVDESGGVRTPAGMLVFRWTPTGDLEVLDRKLNKLVTLTALELLRMRAEWMSRR